MQVTGLELKAYKVTPEGANEMKAELERLRERRREVAEEIQDITSQSNDFGSQEDSTRVINQNQALELDSQIDLLERVIGMSEVVEPEASPQAVVFGAHVRVKVNGDEREYQLVGSPEVDPEAGKISDESPVGHALLGKKVGDRVEIDTPSGEREVAVIEHIS